MSIIDEHPREHMTLTFCLQEDSILLNKAALEALDSPKQVQILINEEQKMLLLQACTVDDREAVIIPQMPFSHFEMSGHSLLKRIRRLTGWSDDLPRVVYGEYVSPHKVIVFDLMLAHPAELGMPLDSGSARPN